MKLKVALITGAGGGIGLAIVRNLLQSNEYLVYANYHSDKNSQPLFDLKKKFKEKLILNQADCTVESEVKNLSNLINENKIDLLINTIGVLHSDTLSPEKSLKDFNSNDFLEIMNINVAITLLLAKYFGSTLNDNSYFVSLSAKVGSISDNRMGGWYSYRISKAALNMAIKNISLEFKRATPQAIVLAIHPGTTDTKLSKPYSSRRNYKLHSPDESAINILRVIKTATKDSSGKFLSWDGGEIKW